MGVLVAISIPIFTAQLRKARLATNQANARSAYAAAMAEELSKISSSSSGGGTYVYKVADGSISAGSTAATKITAAIADWTIDTACDSNKLGDKVATEWTVTITTTTTDGTSGALSTTATDVKYDATF